MHFCTEQQTVWYEHLITHGWLFLYECFNTGFPQLKYINTS